MTKEEMTKLVSAELEAYLPRIYKNYTWNMVRCHYNSMRRHDLAQKTPEGPQIILEKARLQAFKIPIK